MDRFESKHRAGKKARRWLPLFLPILIALLIGGMIYVFTYHINQFWIDLKLNGNDHMILEYGSHYVEPGAAARFYGTHLVPEGLGLEVRISGSVDEKKTGTYEIVYESSHESWSARKIRTVEIVDSEPPQIWLVEKPGTYVIPGDFYREEGFMARDNYDGDLTDTVQKTVLSGKIIYEVKDSNGNSAQAVRELVYYDPVPPAVVLEGDSYITLKEGQPYQEPGFTASDNCDGDLTAQVRISGAVDVNTPGVYKLYYTAEDRFGNSDTEVRIIQVKAKPKPKPQQPEVVPSGKIIYLTFDDGPSKHTERLLEILKQYNVKATFFVIKTSHMDLIDDIVSQGHSIAAHSYSHDYKRIYSGEEAYFEDLQKILDEIEKRSGVCTKLIRFPGGSSNTVSDFNKGIMGRLTNAAVDRGFRYFDWNVDSNDAGGAKTAEKVYENVINGVQSRRVSIVLQHDTKSYSVEAVEKIILWGLENGYTFLPLKEDSPTAAHELRN